MDSEREQKSGEDSLTKEQEQSLAPSIDTAVDVFASAAAELSPLKIPGANDIVHLDRNVFQVST